MKQPLPSHVWAKQIALAATYLLLGLLVHRYIIGDNIISIVWPSSGIALGALLLGGRKYIWGILLGSLALNIANHDSLFVISGITLANVTEALLGHWLLTRDRQRPKQLRNLHEFIRLVMLGGCAAAILGATLGTLSLLAAGYFTSVEVYFDQLTHWWMGDTLGVILLTPLLISWRYRSPLLVQQRVEATALFLVTFLVGQTVFLDWFHQSLGLIARGYWEFLFISLIAIRLSRCAVSVVLVMTALQAVMGAYIGTGFFANDIAKTGLHNYWFYMITLSVVGMTLVTYVNEIKVALVQLKVKDHALNAAANAIVITDLNGKIEWANASFSRLTGYSVEEALGHNPRELLKSGKHDQNYYKNLWDTITCNQVWRGELINRRKDGSYYHEDMTITPMSNDLGEVERFVAVKQDITERKMLEAEIHALAFYDPLTQLPNRRLLDDRMQQVIAASKRSGIYAAFMVLDLDNFKSLNDAQGHVLGDLLLVEVAHRLMNCVRAVDSVARFGGDEFIVLLHELDADKEKSTALAAAIAEKIRLSLSVPYLLATKNSSNEVIQHHCTASIGVAIFGKEPARAGDVLKWADAAMYQSKDNGRNQVTFIRS